MSRFIEEILKDLKDNPETFMDYHGNGVQKGNIKIYQYGNSRMLSRLRVYINGKDIPTSYIDRWRLEAAITKWYRSVSLDVLKVLPVNNNPFPFPLESSNDLRYRLAEKNGLVEIGFNEWVKKEPLDPNHRATYMYTPLGFQIKRTLYTPF